jgi:nitrogenase molybdenum-iron protein alpha/beta subunit
VESIAREAEKQVGCRVLALRSEGFGGDFRSGYEDAFKLIMDLMEPPEEKRKGAVNILGARWGPTLTEFTEDLDEIKRLLSAVGISINAVPPELGGGGEMNQVFPI